MNSNTTQCKKKSKIKQKRVSVACSRTLAGFQNSSITKIATINIYPTNDEPTAGEVSELRTSSADCILLRQLSLIIVGCGQYPDTKTKFVAKVTFTTLTSKISFGDVMRP